MDRAFKKLIGKGIKPFIIAEISANHCGSIAKAKKMISAAKAAGASAVKIQTYQAESMTINSNKPDFKIKHGLWKGQKLYDLYKSAQTPFSWHERLFKHAKKKGILLFSTPFDCKGVDLLERLNVPLYKVASFDLTDESLISEIARTKKPIIGVIQGAAVGGGLGVSLACDFRVASETTLVAYPEIDLGMGDRPRHLNQREPPVTPSRSCHEGGASRSKVCCRECFPRYHTSACGSSRAGGNRSRWRTSRPPHS